MAFAGTYGFWFFGDLSKGTFVREFVDEFEPDSFFSDQTGHIENAAAHVSAGRLASEASNP